ncbi:MAG: prenyltransferase/squalene oxidase repeat-containing protein [Planctomycetaceae bacterium]
MNLTRREMLGRLAGGALLPLGLPRLARAEKVIDPKVSQGAINALNYLAREQRRQGYWEANTGQYRVAMTALAGTAMLCEGSTTTRGQFAKNIRLAVGYLLETSQPNGLIGYKNDFHYTYGHGFSMLFLSQIFGEEEDTERREELQRVLTKAVEFSISAQTNLGGWGYVSAKDGNNFDEGSTCVTQVQGLRACRNAGIPVPKASIEAAIKYIRDCMTPDGGIQYSIRGGGARPAITAAACATLFNAGEYDSDQLKLMLDYCKKNVWPGGSSAQYFGHWHYTHYYYAQVMYRLGGDDWVKYFKEISKEILSKQSASGAWKEGHIGPVYTTAINATILQLDYGYLPIYQK